MGSKTIFGVQTFITNSEEKLVSGRFCKCKSADEAKSMAERYGGTKGTAGAAALQLVNDDDIGITDEPLVLASYGQLPEELLPTIPF